MADIKVYLNKFSERGGRVFALALALARGREQNCVTVEHLIAALAELEAATFAGVLEELQVELSAVQAALAQRLAAGARFTGRGVRLAPETIAVCKLAHKRAESCCRTQIGPVDLFVALGLNGRGNLYSVLGPLGVSPGAILKAVLALETAIEVTRVSVPADAQAIGSSVRILSGPFAGFTGYVANVQREADKLEVDVVIFGQRKFIEVRERDIALLDFKRPGDH